MSATDELRRLLDERGVEWTHEEGTVSFANDGHWCHAWAYSDGEMCVSMGFFTPAQAVEATLGREKCTVKHDVVYGIRGAGIDQWVCSECDHMWWSIDGRPVCCPQCGCEVER